MPAKRCGVPAWFHSLDLGGGLQTAGVKSHSDLASELEALRLPELRAKSVLDIGAWDGFYSFEAERAGASRVVALDTSRGRWTWRRGIATSFLEADERLGDPSNLWSPSVDALIAMCRAAGFERAEVVRSTPDEASGEPSEPRRGRAIVHACR